jgi:soluble lytic murein transglycosylase-like protein
VKKRGLLRVLLALGAGLAGAPRARAALVVFEDGRHLHVTSFEATSDERVALSLPGGGRMTIPLDIVERIVDDEIDRSPVVPLAPAAPGPLSAKPAARSVRAFSAASSLPASPFTGAILEAARAHRIDPALIAAVIRVESNYAPRAVSRKGARGLMQLMPATARRLGVTRSFDPRENIRGGTAYLAELAFRFGETSVDLILAAYNAGERAVEEYQGVPPFRETREYVRKVLALWAAAPATAGL